MRIFNRQWGRSLAVIAGAAILASAALAFDRVADAKSNGRAVPILVSDTPVRRDGKMTTSFAPVVKQVAPAVVNIFSTKTVRNAPGQMPNFDDPFRWFFGDRFRNNQSPQRRPLKEQSLGSGVIVTKDGYILTNNHVVDGADEVKVSLNKGNQQWTAKVVGRDPKTDIAVLKIDANKLSFITFGNSDNIEVGDVVLAVGNPFGVGQAVTMGIISAVGRGGMGIEDYEDFIQTDASINPGNSGGALVDAEGRLIGINTAILSRSGGNQGIGFAVPVNLARGVMEQLIKHGKVVRGFLGVGIQDLTPELAKQFNLPDSGGALVNDVIAGGAAEQAGLKSGDVIVELNGKPVPDSRNLKLMVGHLAPGAKTTVKVLRDGKEKTLTVNLKELTDQNRASSNEPNAENQDEILSGVGVADITPDMRKQFEIPESLQGAIVTEVDPNSVAAEAGLRPGDVIQEINRKPIKSSEDAVNASRNVKEKKALVRLWSQGHSRYVMVDESSKK